MTTPNRIITPGTQIKFQCGDLVSREDDPRHEGVVCAIIRNCARVIWMGPDQMRWKEDVEQDDLVLIARKRRSTGGPRSRPSTVKESPRAQLERWMAERNGE
jgi:hypothetical protein